MQRVRALDALVNLLKQSESGVEVATSYNAAGYLGVSYIKAMHDAAKKQCPDKSVIVWADCADDSALVMAGIRVGLTHMLVDVPDEMFEKLDDMARQSGAQLRRASLHFADCSATPT